MRPYKGSSLVRLHKWVKFELNFVVVDFFGITRIELCYSLKMIIFSSLSWYQSISEKITATTANIYWWHWPKPMCGWFQSIDKKAHRSVGFIWVIIIVYILFLNYYFEMRWILVLNTSTHQNPKLGLVLTGNITQSNHHPNGSKFKESNE